MYGSTSYEYTDVLVAREMERDYFGPYLVTEIFRYCPFWGSNRSQRKSRYGLKQGVFIYFLDYSWGILSHQKLDHYFIFVE